ncbi:hypothetical protein [Gimesia fumaroli]|jgi:Spy/CpxP family protein refolding chaperone|uniref:LTXXQ motif protein n=1 Tax=Gimesia fumaroli TaxID=2527976 RepID=A0A518IEH4_9PLAN|nr:hypothetical protein [Gimesia fumaroli]QDV51475.1 hypothetical protein Enr17x_35310 [Gimesia fumaroli]
MFQQKALRLIVVLFTGIALTVCTADSVPAQKKEAGTPKTSAKDTKETKTTRKKSKGRVPPHYGKLNLTQEQKNKIYAIKAGYKTQIDSLKKQLEELNNKQKTDCETVLTPEQKANLAKILAEVASKRKSKSKN